MPPASSLPMLARGKGGKGKGKSERKGAGGKVVIVNLQWTSKDKGCALKINARCDDVMWLLGTKRALHDCD